MKATSVFGGVQVFSIIINIIRSKFVALLLGPVGMGIAGLIDATTGMVAGLTNFGLSTSAVKNISAAQATGNTIRVSTVITVFRRLVWLTGLLGAFATIAFSPWLSQVTFGNREYTWAFIWVSITLLLNQISAGQSVLLRGMRQIGYMAKSGIIGSVLGLVTTVPLYYFFGMQGIVPGIIVTSVTSLILTWYFARKLNIKLVYVSKARTIAEGKSMLKVGFLISLSGLITLGASYIVRIYISKSGGVDQVGLYNAGFFIINTYAGFVFKAMSMDYYPRLSAVSNSNIKSRQVINQQAEIALLILSPVIMVFLVFINWVVIILYSASFFPINDMILFGALSMLFKAASWSIGFIFLAKGDGKLFFWNELIGNLYVLGLNLLGYYFSGLKGLGVSLLVSYILHMIQIYIVARLRYEFFFSPAFKKIFILQLAFASICLLVVKVTGSPFSFLFGSLIIAVSACFSIYELDKRLDIKSLVLVIKKRL